MSDIETGGPAFPRPTSEDGERFGRNNEQYHAQEGMTLRDHFAGLAMQGMVASGCTVDIAGEYPFEQRAGAAYLIADAMLKARNAKE